MMAYAHIPADIHKFLHSVDHSGEFSMVHARTLSCECGKGGRAT